LILDDFGFADLSVPINPSMVGSTEFYQWFYRDPTHTDGTGIGLTDALRVPYCP
jgi:hypothetical protein